MTRHNFVLKTSPGYHYECSACGRKEDCQCNPMGTSVDTTCKVHYPERMEECPSGRLHEGKLVVEITLDPEYLTPDGMYMAGYHWGQHVRNPDEDQRVINCGYDDFIQGARDGYGDKMRELEEKIRDDKQKKENETKLARAIKKKTKDEAAARQRVKSSPYQMYDWEKNDPY